MSARRAPSLVASLALGAAPGVEEVEALRADTVTMRSQLARRDAAATAVRVKDP